MPLLSSKGEPLQNPYELLKLEHGATDDEISKSFKKLMLQLHPDKQPPGQSIEDAKNVERLMYDVMEARSFLLDTEYMAGRRLYDSKLVLAKQKQQEQQLHVLPPRSTGIKKDVNIGMTKQQQETKISPVPGAATPPVTSTKVGGGKTTTTTTTRAKSTSKSRLESATDNNNNNNNKAATAARETKSTLDGLGSKMNETTASSSIPAIAELSVEKLEKLLAAKKAEKSNTSSSTLSNKNLNKKQWGKVKTKCRAAANVTKKKVDDSNNKKKKDNSKRVGKASFSNSCSDCSTTEDNTTSDDDLKLNSINSDSAVSSSKKSATDVDAATTANNKKPSSSTTAMSSIPQPSNNSSSNSSNKGKQKSFHDSLPQLPERQKSFHNSRPQPGRQKSFHDSRPQLLQPPSQPIIEKCERSKSFSGTPLHPLLHPTTVKGKCYQQIFECDTPIEVVKPPKIYDHPRPILNDVIPVPQRRSCLSTIGYTSTSLHPPTAMNTTLLLEKQYYCPLTKNIMKEPMSDNEGNTYERQAILTYLEIHNNKSPITGNALSPIQLIPNISLAEQIRLALISCLDTLQNNSTTTAPATAATLQTQNNPPPQHQQQHQQHQHHDPSVRCEVMKLRHAVNGFIHDLNSGLPTITISQLDSTGTTTFLYSQLKYRLDVPNALSNNIIIQTWYEQSNKQAIVMGNSISTLISKFNTSLQKTGINGRLTFRNVNGKYVFSLTKNYDMSFDKTTFRHGIEYFVEMSIKLYNIINPSDARPIEKVRLTNSVTV